LLHAARFKNPSKSTLAHVAVAAAVLHKHHLIIRGGAGLIQLVYGSRSHLVNGGYPSQKCVFTIFAEKVFWSPKSPLFPSILWNIESFIINQNVIFPGKLKVLINQNVDFYEFARIVATIGL